MTWARIALALAPLILGGVGAWWINDRAYERGVSDTKAAIQKVIEKKASESKADREAIKTLPDKDIDCELLKMRGEEC